MTSTSVLYPTLLAILWCSSSFVLAESTIDDVDFFERKIRPVLVERCYGCHSLESGKSKGGLRVDSKEALRRGGDSGPAIVEKDPLKSLLMSAIRYESNEMPPDGKLQEEVIAAFERWILDGAVDPRSEADSTPTESFVTTIDYERGKQHWAFQPLAGVELPLVHMDWGSSAIDRWVAATLKSKGLAPSEPASPSILLRRVTFDLIGIPPSIQEMEEYLRDDSPWAYERVVDRLLQSPRFGERWARPWLDLSRYAEDQAHIVGDDRSLCYPNAYRYRDWLIHAFNSDMPYDQFVRLQLAADLMPEAENRDLPALGFMGLGPKYYRRNAPEVMADEWEDRVDVLSRGLLGLTVACARCHDHKLDPIGTEDYYALAGIFASSEMFNQPLSESIELGKNGQAKSPSDALHILKESTPVDLNVMIRGDVARKGPLVPRRFLKVLSDGEPPRFVEGSGRRELAATLASSKNPLFARVMVNRIWQTLFGQGIVRSTSNFGRMGDPPSHQQLLDAMAAQWMEHDWSIKYLLREIVLSETYRQSSQHRQSAFDEDPTNLWLWRMNRKRLQVEAWRDAVLFVAGELDHAIGGKSIDPSLPSSNRRTLYAEVSRLSLNRMLASFDFPDPNAHSDGRVRTVNPLQKLFLLNSPFMLAQAEAMERRLERTASHPVDRIQAGYQLLFARQPSKAELEESLRFIGEDPSRWKEWTHAMLASNEFATID